MLRRKNQDRRGAVTVEFAFVAPLFVTMFVGLTQVSYLLQVQNQFASAAREGARIASYDRGTFGDPGESTNDKVERDIRTFLEASGMPSDDIEIVIAHADDLDQPFDLDDPANAFEYFQVYIEYPVSDLLSVPPPTADEFNISARVVFRNGRID